MMKNLMMPVNIYYHTISRLYFKAAEMDELQKNISILYMVKKEYAMDIRAVGK
jgi:hypothetical protein